MYGERIDDVFLAVERACGGLAEVNEYTASLSQLTLRVKWPESALDIHLVCNGCTRLEMFTAWKIARLSIARTETGYLIEDIEGKFFVECQSVRAFESVDSLNC